MKVYAIVTTKYFREAGMITDQYTEITDIFENESDANKLKEYIESKIDGEVYVDEFTIKESVNIDDYFI
jgi:hypothetical protein